MSIKSNVTAALNSAHSYAAAVEALRKDCAGMEKPAAREAMLPCVAAFYAVPVVEGKLDREAKKYEAAKKALQRLLAAIYPESDRKEEIEVPEELLKAAAVLAKLAAKYEGARSLASKALAQSFAA